MLLTFTLLIVGFVALILGANWLVDGATSVGIRAKLSPLIIGLTIVAFGTSLPELIVNIFSCAKGSSGLAIGNIIGSNTMNILLILGVSAMIFPIDVNNISIKRDIPAGFIATLALTLMANDFFIGSSKSVNWIEGIVLLLLGAFYLYMTMKKSESPTGDADVEQIPLPWEKTILLLFAGIGCLYLGGELVSRNAQELARSWGMDESMIGLTIVATATSLPELITSIVAATKKNSDIAIGNVVGSNILNIFIVLGISALIMPLEFKAQMNIQLLILFAANALMLLFVLTGKGRHKLSRVEGLLMLSGYVAFLTYSIISA